MVYTAEVVKKNYESIISKTETYLHSSGRFDVFGSKDKLSRLPVYILGNSMKEMSIDLANYDVGPAYNQCSDLLIELAGHEFEFNMEARNKFLQPKMDFLKTDIKEAFHHYDKLKSRRLDYDAKRHKLRDARAEKVTKYEAELQLSQRKLDESTDLTRQYFSYVANQEERATSQHAELMSFMHSMMEYHQRCFERLKALDEQMHFAEHMYHTPPPRPQIIYDRQDMYSPAPGSLDVTGDSSSHRSPSSTPPLPRYQRLPQCRALYNFTPQQSGDLEFHKGDILEITREINQDWWEGMIDGRTGLFPSNYVERL